MVCCASVVVPSEKASDAMQLTCFIDVLPSFSAVVRSFVVLENLVRAKAMSLLFASATMV